MVTTVGHPLAGHLLAGLRDRDTPPELFRTLTRRLTTVLILEATSDLDAEEISVPTPLEETSGRKLAQPLAAVPVLRAGLGMLDAVVDLFPEVRVGYIGLERDEATFEAAQYYSKLPKVDDAYVILLDPMLATGGSAAAALRALKGAGAKKPRMVSVVAAPEGIKAIEEAHPDVEIYTAAVDRELNRKAFILPGLGDFGDRLYGTQQ
ncbi:MAG: uracil phosphoribosyltransferase [Actinomycetota bacterium]|nr:uracil phosphoribosyltransferase [Actinomycetota bacterium]